MFSLDTIKSIYKYIVRSPVAGPPLRASLTLSNKCNLRCITCSTWNRGDDFKNELRPDELLRVVDELIDSGVRIFYLFGGEPLLYPGFFDVVKKISAKGLFSETVSNGTLINEETAKKIIDSGLNKIWISLDGPCGVHDEIRGIPGTFDRALHGLKLICEEKKKTNSPILIDLAVTVSHINYKHLVELVDLVKDLPLFEVNIRHMGVFFKDDLQNIEKVLGVDMGGKNTPLFSRGEDKILTPEDIKELRPILRDLQSRKYNFALHIEPHFFTVDDWSIGRTDVHTCFHLWTQICINADGKVNPCMWWDGYVVGDVRKDSIMKIWNSPGFNKIRKNISKLSACSKCTYFYRTLPENIKRAVAVPNFPFKSLFKK